VKSFELLAGQRAGAPGVLGGQLGLGALCLAQRLLPVGLQRARHQPVLRLAGVKLAPRPLGFVARALDREFERSEAGGL
jgi:hypothetical protein